MAHSYPTSLPRCCRRSPVARCALLLVPLLVPPLLFTSVLDVARMMIFESTLGFLGLGVQEPATSWGALIAEGSRAIESAPWMLAAPAGFLVATLVALNLLGDGLADALDPRLSEAR